MNAVGKMVKLISYYGHLLDRLWLQKHYYYNKSLNL